MAVRWAPRGDVIGPGEFRRVHAAYRSANPRTHVGSGKKRGQPFHKRWLRAVSYLDAYHRHGEVAAMSNVTYHPYSDFAIHHMGSRLSDGINQGAAGPDQFRTAPLWGLGQRLFFLHDGRTADLMQAIQAHSSQMAQRPIT